MTTPMMAQWHACKTQAKEALLFFRLGDFYEAFHEDANLISKELGLTLTARQGVPMCGIPSHTVDSYLDKLVAKGYRVAVAEQTEDAKETKGLVKREIVKTVSPGTLIHSQLLSDKKNNYFVSLSQVNSTYGIAALDLTTAEFRAMEVESKTDLLDELYRLKPAEILLSRNFRSTHSSLLQDLSLAFPFAVAEQELWRFDFKSAHELLLSHSIDLSRVQGQLAAIGAAGALVGYLTQELSIRLDHVSTLSSEPLQQFMAIDRSTLRNLELVESMQGGKGVTLLSLIDRTATPMGGRLLAHWIKHPLLSPTQIAKRQDAVEELLDYDPSPLSDIRDLERLSMKVASRQANPRDLLALGLSLAKLPRIEQSLTRFQADLIGSAKRDLQDPISHAILSAISDHPPLRIGEGEIFKAGYNPELDHLRSLTQNSIVWMNDYQNRLREETGIKTLKVGYTRAFGYYIEVSRAQSEKIPPGFHRRQTLVNAERWITDELKSFEHQVLTAEERAKALEAQLFETLRETVAEHTAILKKSAQALGLIDALASLASVAAEGNWICPQIDDSNIIEIFAGRHPIVESMIGKNSFIPNDLFLSPDQQLLLLTGPNMAGKSTYIRQAALLVLLAQMGSFIPADKARIGIVDKIFSRIGASDDLARGQSTFMVEMSETANILLNSTSRSLVLLDEIGRGTSTYDGISIAWAVAETLLTTSRAKTLFATHYWELTRLPAEIPHAANFQVAIQETSDGIVFLRKIIPGATDKSYGIHVAQLAGLPPATIRRAQEILQKLESHAPKSKRKSVRDEQLSFFP